MMRKPESFVFSAELGEPTRVKLYKFLAKQIAKKADYFLVEYKGGGAQNFLFIDNYWKKKYQEIEARRKKRIERRKKMKKITKDMI